MEDAHIDESLEIINSRILAANALIHQLDRTFSAEATRKSAYSDTFQTFSHDLKSLSASYKVIQSMLSGYPIEPPKRSGEH